MFPHMMNHRMHGFRKGMLQHMVLKSLADKPKHGYEIMQSLGEEFEGSYQPSPGTLYPILQMLEEEGYVTGKDDEGKRTYSITPEGSEYLKASEERFRTLIENRKAFFGERRALSRELRNLGSLVMTNYHDMSPEKSERIAQIIKEARRKIDDIISE
jgi:DNA-binding PadR family transcriptional regulator